MQRILDISEKEKISVRFSDGRVKMFILDGEILTLGAHLIFL